MEFIADIEINHESSCKNLGYWLLIEKEKSANIRLAFSFGGICNQSEQVPSHSNEAGVPVRHGPT